MKPTLLSLSIAATMALTLVGCGSGGGSSSEPPVDDNDPIEQPTPTPDPSPLPTPELPSIDGGTVVTSSSALQSAIDQAQAGEVILLANGDWHDLELDISASGSSERPIIVAAETAGKVHLIGTSTIEINGDYVRLDGLVWHNAAPAQFRGLVVVNGSDNTISNHTIFGGGVVSDSNCQNQDRNWIGLGGQRNQVVFNRFEGKCDKGEMITVWRDDNSEDHHLIHFNEFYDYQPNSDASNGYETIRIGTSTESQSDSFTTVSYNRFEQINGEIEIISSKSGGNSFSHNTFINSDGLLTLRHGKNNLVEHNLFLQSGSNGGGGIRIFDSGHIIRNNYIEGVDTSSSSRGGIVIHAGINEHGTEPSSDPDDNELNKQWTANNLLIEHNTLYNSDQGIYQNAYLGSSSCKDGSNNSVPCQPGWDVTFSSNLAYHRSGQAVTLAEQTEIIGASYSNEIYWGSSGAGHSGNGISTSAPTLYSDADSGLVYRSGVGADLSQLQLLSRSDVGPSYLATPK